MGDLVQEKRKILIDTDAGIDDAQAILVALSRPDIEVVAITTVRGNTHARQVSLNVLRLLKVADSLHIPVYQGADKSLLGVQTDASYYHGADGFGDVPDPQAPDAGLIQTEGAVSAMLRLLNQYPGKLEILALGPLTNLALAVRQDPAVSDKCKGCYIMGGNYEGRGNVVPCAEFNFYADPEAAFAVLNDLKCPITLVCWETCLRYSFTWDWFGKLTSIDSAKGRFIHSIDKTTLERFYHRQKEDFGYLMADQIIMAVAVEPEIVQERKHVYCSVEVGGRYCRGQMVVDWHGFWKHEPNVQLVTALNQQRLGEIVLSSLQ